MGMIPLPVAETLPASPSGGFTRLSRQPDGQGEEYQPLDLPQEAMLPPSTAPSAPVDETEQEECCRATRRLQPDATTFCPTGGGTPSSCPFVIECRPCPRR